MPRHVDESLSSYLGPGALSTFALAAGTAIAGLGVPVAWRLQEVLRCARLDERQPADAILILGRTLDLGAISEVFRARLDHGLTLLAAGLAPRIVVSGGLTGRSRRTEAEAGREYLLEKGLSESQLLIEDRSRHTMENLRNVRETARAGGWRRVLLVSDPLHLARAIAFARGLRLEMLCSGAPGAAPHRGSPGWWLRAVREATLLHWYHVGVAYSRLIRSERLLSRVT